MMKTIFIVSRKPDFTASRLMEESALTSHGYICCGMYKVHEMLDDASVFVGEMSVAKVMECIKKEYSSYRIERVSDTASSNCVVTFTSDPQVLYVSARNLE